MINAYDKLFENTLLSFNHKQGGVDLGIELKKEIHLKPEITTYWIEKALERMGFNITRTQAINIPQLEIRNTSGKTTLIYSDNSQQKEFDSIYGLSRFLLKDK